VLDHKDFDGGELPAPQVGTRLVDYAAVLLNWLQIYWLYHEAIDLLSGMSKTL